MSGLVRILVRLHRRLAGLAPASAREFSDDAGATFESVIRTAGRQRGLWGVLVVSTQEFVDLALAIVREHRDVRRASRAPHIWTVAPVWRDFRLAGRAVWSARGTSLLAAATLALGVGTSAAVFSVYDSMLLRQVPFPEGDRLVEIWNFSLDQKVSFRTGAPVAVVARWREETDLFDRVEGFERRSLVLEDRLGASEVAGALLTPGTFDLLGAVPHVGRRFLDHEGLAGARPVAVVSHTFWTSHLGQRRDLDHVRITLDGTTHDVVGVMPASFRFPTGNEHVWIAGAPKTVTPLARIREGLDFDRAAAEATARGERVTLASGGPPGLSATLTSLGNGLDERTQATLFVLAAAVAFLFLIVCVNVANLTLSRALERTRDLGTFAALGASRASLIRVVFFEQSLIALTGVVLGGGVAVVVTQIAVAALPDVMTYGTLNAIDLDGRALTMLCAAGVGTLLICGLPPAWLATRVTVVSAMGHSGRTTTGSRFARRLRTTLAVAEVAVSVALLAGAALMARSFVALASVDHGYSPQGLVSLRLGLPASGYTDPDVAAIAVRDVAQRISALPGVEGVTIGGLPSDSGLLAFGALMIDGQPEVADPRAAIPIHEVDASYFQVLRLPIRAGRGFIEQDIPGAAIVNERFAAKYFANDDPIGRRYRVGRGDWRTIVGVAGDTLGDGERASRRAESFYPVGQAKDAARAVLLASSIAHFVTLQIRATDPSAVMPLLAGAVHDRDPAIVVWRTSLVARILAEAIARPRVVFVTMLLFAMCGLVLAMVGLYGVLSHLVAQRRHEIGVRLALGAGAVDIRRLVFGHALGLTAAGIALGVCAAWPMIRLMQSLLFEVQSADPAALAGAIVAVGITAAAASWAPARKAGRTNPVELFRGN